MHNRARLSKKISIGVTLVLACGLSLGLGIIYSKEKENLNHTIHDKAERTLLSLKSSHTQAMLFRGHKKDNNPVLQALNGTIESMQVTQEQMNIWLIMGSSVIDFQRKAGSNEIEPPRDDVDREALSSLKPVGRYISDSIYRYTIPIILGRDEADNPACFSCHGADMGIQDGEAIGGFSVSYDATEDLEHFRSLLYSWVAIFIFIVVVIAIAIVVYINRLISQPVENIASIMDRISEADKGVLIPDPASAESFEIAEILKSLTVFNNHYRSNVNELVEQLSEQKYAIDQHSIVATTDIRGTITEVNDKFCEISGYSKEELIGANHRILNSGNQPKEYWRDMFRTVSKGGVWHDEVLNMSKLGTPYWVDTTILPVMSKSQPDRKRVKGYISIRTDITEKKEQENKLIAARIDAESAVVAKSQFLATMSHEIRTPMNGVIGMAQLLEDTPLNSEQKDFLGTITRSGNSLLDIINDILDFSKLDADMVEIESISFDLERLCQESLELVVGNSINSKLQFIFDYHPDCPRLFTGDPARLRQVLINLIGNAYKFTKKGYLRLSVWYENEGSTTGSLRLEIQDSGIGMKPETLEHLFDEFTQADSSTTREFGGTGLGLAITKKLVSLMGGQIGVNSVYGEGTTFWINFSLPRAEAPEIIKSPSLQSVRILFVDNNRENCRIFNRILEHMGTNPVIISDPTQTIEILTHARQEDQSFQIVILGHNMPEFNGIQLGKDIRLDNRFDDLKLLLFPSRNEKGDTALSEQAGFNGYLNKLSRYETLRSMLSAILQHTPDRAIITQHNMSEASQSEGEIKIASKASILLVEDILPNQIIARKLLTNMEFRVDIANNGREAIEAFSNKTYDLILMDCRMPEMDGYDATKAIRSLEKENNTPPIPVIALTANASSDERILCKESGMNDVITKPFKRTDLSSSLLKWLPAVAPSIKAP
ncbi:MAG: response regulator [Gammaproteobacteria bacterium]|nr:response regulator [Gammaproteobacteria bacterium]